MLIVSQRIICFGFCWVCPGSVLHATTFQDPKSNLVFKYKNEQGHKDQDSWGVGGVYLWSKYVLRYF